MAKNSASMAKDVSLSMDFIMRILIGVMFICMGVGGCMDTGYNDLFKAIDNEFVCVVLGIVLILSGALFIVPSFLKGISPVFVSVSMIIVTVVWVGIIIFGDFVHGLKGVDGAEWFEWMQNFITHLLVLSAIFGVTGSAFKKK
jgi:hypothetical protein